MGIIIVIIIIIIMIILINTTISILIIIIHSIIMIYLKRIVSARMVGFVNFAKTIPAIQAWGPRYGSMTFVRGFDMNMET